MREQEPEPLAVLGHEMRNLIATFVGFTELLLTQEWPPEKQREYLETMRDEGVRVSQFLNELLDLQRLEAGASLPKPRPTNIAELLEFAADVAAHDPRHPVSLELQDHLPLALAEPDRIQQVLANLLSNARKYSPRGGPIRLSARAKRGVIEVCVEDSGVGLPPESIGRVFDKFYRVESLMHRNVRGTGLGLAICQQIVQAHRGRIWAESAGLGHGARFCFTLPAAPKVSARRTQSGVHARGRGVTSQIASDVGAVATSGGFNRALNLHRRHRH
ncbi:MAG: HAMP domain-containing histidine kinase [Chloroflexi bacterium]|nr:HAMP domain-containing histidine kinase [Chloroflexota bacterium]MBV9893663.1 HAMP domain-containing histidine kinase [Chloroflexota bacterium]